MNHRNLKMFQFQNPLFTVTSSLLRTVLRPSTQRVGFPAPTSRSVDYFEVVIRQLLSPLNLSLVPDFFGQKGLYILVVRIYRHGFFFPPEVSFPFFERLHYCEKFLVMYLLISFSAVQFLRMESHWVKTSPLVLRQYASEREVASVCLHYHLSSWVKMR